MTTKLQANIAAGSVEGGRIAENILMFARVLREAGLAAGPESVILATEAVLAAGIANPKHLYWTLHAVFVKRRVDHDIFHQAFALFWRDPGYLQQLLSILTPNLRQPPREREDAMARRLADSLFTKREAQHANERDQLEIDARGTLSDVEVLAAKDFEQMTAEELRLSRLALQKMDLLLAKRPLRRFVPSRKPHRLNMRRILRQAASQGGDALLPYFRSRKQQVPPLVVLCDISGSMEIYARLMLHFLYALANGGTRVHIFLFGTRLSNISHHLRGRDPDAAIAKVSGQVQDWAGGTRIGHAISEFNRHWGRRVLGQNATVLLITEGLDRCGGEGMAVAARRLRASSRRLIWLNPLLRYDAYKPLTEGAVHLARHVCEVRSCHNMNSLAGLAQALSKRP